MRIAHFSDPHINSKYHPKHLVRLRSALEDALENQLADHVVITGDLTSNGDARDLRSVRRLFESLGILASSKLTLIPGNHDLYGGPHLAEEVLGFPERCRTTDLNEKLAIFQDTFAEVFTDSIQTDAAYPFLKKVRNICFLGLNSITEYSLLDNPVGSNGRIGAEQQTRIRRLSKHHAWQTASQRIVLIHHHLFRPKDVSHLQLADGVTSKNIAALIEQRTLKLHGKRSLLQLCKEIDVDLILHGHVHFTGDYERKGIAYLNSAGSIYPVERGQGYFYHLVDLKDGDRTVTTQKAPNVRKSRAT